MSVSDIASLASAAVALFALHVSVRTHSVATHGATVDRIESAYYDLEANFRGACDAIAALLSKSSYLQDARTGRVLGLPVLNVSRTYQRPLISPRNRLWQALTTADAAVIPAVRGAREAIDAAGAGEVSTPSHLLEQFESAHAALAALETAILRERERRFLLWW